MLIRVARFLADLPTVKFIALQSISFVELSDLLTSQPNVLSCRLKSDETLVERTGPAASFFSRSRTSLLRHVQPVSTSPVI